MKKYLSLLRGINVGGQKKIKMVDLKAMYEAEGLAQVRTYIQSGNVIFKSDQSNKTLLIQQIEAAILKTFGYEVPVSLFSLEDFTRIMQANPFAPVAEENYKRVYLILLAEPPAPALAEALSSYAPQNGETFTLTDECVYLFCPNGYGRSKLSNNFFERKLKVSATTRNWNSMLKLNALMEQEEI